MSEPTEHDVIIGIDLGTTNSLVAYADESGPRILPDDQGRAALPSVVRLNPQQDCALGKRVEEIGHEARLHAVEHPEHTIFSVKRLMGRSLEDVADVLPYLPYQVVAGEHNTARIQIGNTIATPQEVSAIILHTLRMQAERRLGGKVRKAVITVPAYFDDAQRQATRDAGRIAGLEVVRIVNEPTAAALAYGIGLTTKPKPSNVAEKSDTGAVSLNTKVNPEACDTDEAARGLASDEPAPESQTVAVFDLGGGTFDISILHLEHTDEGIVDQVLATAGDTHLGGDDVDRMLIALMQREIIEQFFPEHADRDPNELFPASTRQAFRNFAESTKIELSNRELANLEIDLGGGRTYQRQITRDELEQMMQPWLDKAMQCCRDALKAAKLEPADIERVIMVGGSTRIPMVRRGVAELFDTDPYTALNPDEVVALGAAVQASIMAGVRRDALLLDVIPLSLGIETLGGAVAKLIMANDTIPCRATEHFTTYVEGQTNVKIHVLQGERELVSDCRSLGEFDLTGIPPMPAGLPKIEVTFLVDANGILNVSAIEQRSGKAAKIQIIPNHGLTRDEVERMESDAFEHATEDMTAHQLIDLRNQARLDIRQIKKQLEKVGDDLDADYRAEIEKHIDATQAMIDAESPDPEQFHQTLDAMDKATVRLAEVGIASTLRQEQEAEK